MLTALTAKQAVEYVQTFNPDVYMPAHHDGSVNELWRPTEPLFEALKSEDPALVTISRSIGSRRAFDTHAATATIKGRITKNASANACHIVAGRRVRVTVQP